MLIMSGSYRDQGLFARPIRDLAVAIRPANPPVGPWSGASKAGTSGISDNKTLDWVAKRIGLLPLPHHICGGLCARNLRRRQAVVKSVKCAESLPPRQETSANNNLVRS